MPRLDQAFCTRAIATALKAALDTATFGFADAGMPDPEDVAKWVRLLSVDFDHAHQRSSSDEDRAGITVRLACMASAATLNPDLAGSIYADESTAAKAAEALDLLTSYDTTTTHLVQLGRPRLVKETSGDDEASVVSYGIEIPGLAQRSSGTSLETHPGFVPG